MPVFAAFLRTGHRLCLADSDLCGIKNCKNHRPHKSFIMSHLFNSEIAMSTSLTITEFNTRVAQLIERQIPLLWVKGEISNLTRAASGHWYFSLKDDKAQVRAVMFRQKNTLLSFAPREGDAVEAQVLAGLYAPRGDFQLTVETMKRAGLGNLYERFLKLKDELQQQGLFDDKKPLPSFVRTIGLITSPQAAALRDVMHTLQRRAPHIEVFLYPTLVQGTNAATQIAQAIRQANQNKKLDALLIVRGGGSIEDLWSFNEAEVAQAIHASALPTISGVGHETDTTIADFVADVRAATPTAAAELISTPSIDERHNQLNQILAQLKRHLTQHTRTAEQQLDNATLRLLTPAQRLHHNRQKLTQQLKQMQLAMTRHTERSHFEHSQLNTRWQRAHPDLNHHAQMLQRSAHTLANAQKRNRTQKQTQLNQRITHLKQLNPEHILARGFAYVRTQNGRIVYNADSLQAGDGIRIQFADGQVVSTVNHIEPKSAAK